MQQLDCWISRVVCIYFKLLIKWTDFKAATGGLGPMVLLRQIQRAFQVEYKDVFIGPDRQQL